MMNVGKNSNFTQIPNELIYDPNVTPSEFRVCAALLSFGYGANPIFPSQALVSKKIGVSDRTVRYKISSLKKKGYLTYNRRGFNKSNQYNFLSNRKEASFIRGTNFPPKNTSNNTNNKFINEEGTRRGMQHIREIMRTLRKKG